MDEYYLLPLDWFTLTLLAIVAFSTTAMLFILYSAYVSDAIIKHSNDLNLRNSILKVEERISLLQKEQAYFKRHVNDKIIFLENQFEDGKSPIANQNQRGEKK